MTRICKNLNLLLTNIRFISGQITDCLATWIFLVPRVLRSLEASKETIVVIRTGLDITQRLPMNRQKLMKKLFCFILK
jgi:hypothetical protein